MPHIYASSLADVFFAQGFVTASERLFQIDFTLRAATGRLAEMLGELALPLDRFARTVGWNRAGRRIAGTWDDRSHEIVRAWGAGVRAWVRAMPAKPVEYSVIDLEPHLPEEDDELDALVASGTVLMAWGLSGNWDSELLRVEIAERLGFEAMLDLFPDLPRDAAPVTPGLGDPHSTRAAALDLLRLTPHTPAGQGSNNWVVSGARSVTGKPLLANDPHLTVAMPSIWFECHLSAPGCEVSGVALPFGPGVVLGRTATTAWGATNVGGDTQDLYLERLSDDRTAALHGDAWEPLAIHREEIRVRGDAEPHELNVRESRHGPILDSYTVGVANPTVVEEGIAGTYALRWVGADRSIPPSTLVDLAAAADFPAFREALRRWECPGQNFVFADEKGGIGYQCTGAHPIRRAGDGSVPVPGWTDAHEWDGFVPFDELPWSRDPDDGYLLSANQRIHDDAYPYLLGVDFLPPFRARRIAELLAATGTHSRETFAAIQMDTVSLPAREIAPRLREIEPESDRQKEALGYLADWDGDLSVDSVAACIYEVWNVRIAEQVLRPRLGDELYTHYYGRRESTNAFGFQVLPNLLAYPSAPWFGEPGREARDRVLRESLDAAIEELTSALGEDMTSWRWGALHRVRFVGPLGLGPDLEELFGGGVVEVGGDEQTVHQSMFEPETGYDAVVIPSWRVIHDLSHPDGSVGVHTSGQSGNPASEHWDDLVPIWAAGGYHPMPFTREAVAREAASTLRLFPT